MFCRGCGAELREGAQFCPKCGRMVADAGKGKGKKSRKKLVAALSIGGAACIAAVLFVVFGLGFAPGKDTYVCVKTISDSEQTSSDGETTTNRYEYDSFLDMRGNRTRETTTRNGEPQSTCECSFDGNGYATSCRYEYYYNEETETLAFDFQNEVDRQGRIVKSVAKEQHGLRFETTYSYFDDSDAIESISCVCSLESISYDEAINYYSEQQVLSALPDQVRAASGALLDVLYDKKSQGFETDYFSREGVLLSRSGDNASMASYGEPTSLEQRKGQPFSYHREKTSNKGEATVEKQWDENGYLSSDYSEFGAIGLWDAFSSRRSYTYDHVLFPSRAVSIFSRLHYQ